MSLRPRRKLLRIWGERVTVLGPLQGVVCPRRLTDTGTRLGATATDLVAEQQFGRMLCLKAGKMDSVSLDEALEKMKYIDADREIVHAARAARANFGDGR